MMPKRLMYGLLLLLLLAAAGYFYRSANDPAVIPPANTAVERSDKQPSAQQSAAEQADPVGASLVSNAEMQADLNRLVSTDEGIRRKALAELALEFSSTPPRSEGRYSTYGDALLPVLDRVMNDLDDPYAHNAVQATYYLAMVDQTRISADSLGLNDEARAELEKLSHYPIPSNYAPMKAALIRVLTSSQDDKARHWAAMALANGFEPAQEIEGVLAARFPLEEGSRKVQPAILGALSEIGSRGNLMRSTELAIMRGLTSPDKTTKRTSARIIGAHKFDGGRESLIENIPATSDVRTLRMMLDSVVSFGVADELVLAQLEKIAVETNEDELKNEILATVETLRNLSTR